MLKFYLILSYFSILCQIVVSWEEKMKKTFISIIWVLLLSFVFGEKLYAAESETESVKYVTVSTSLNMRTSGSYDSKIITRLEHGTEVQVYSEENGWAQISVNGHTGYVRSNFLTSVKPKVLIKYVTVSTSLNMRTKMSYNSKIIKRLGNGTEVQVYSEKNGWAQIRVNGRTGYVRASFLTSTKPTNLTKYITVSTSLNMRTNPSYNSKIITRLEHGTQVNVYSEKNGWAQIKVNGHSGYVQDKYLSNTKPTILTKYVSVSSRLNMRNGMSYESKIIKRLEHGTEVKVYSEKNGWAQIRVNGRTGYVNVKFLIDTNPLVKEVSKVYQNYDLTLDEMKSIQMKVDPQTDKKYKTYLREDALRVNSTKDPTQGTVTGSGWNVRGGAGADYWSVGKVKDGEVLAINSVQTGKDGYRWYEVDYKRTWVNASPIDVKYHLNPSNFINNPDTSLQFLNLSKTTGLNQYEVNRKILAGKGILEGKASAFISAGQTYGINDIYLISHALLETGNGTSTLANGVKVNGKTVYNMFGIGAVDGSAVSSGSQYAYDAGWFTPEKAILGGAKFIAQGYIDKGQDTLYKMRWNPRASALNGVASHQYATDIGWAVKQVTRISNLYNMLDSYNMTLEIPKYKNQ